MAGLDAATSGRIDIGGADVTSVEPADRGVAMVFQSYALYPHMTVAETMGFGLRMNGLPKAEVAERVARAAGILHLEPLLGRKPKALSGGQRQRVAIGRAIVREPEVFLFDEPLSNLDAELRVKMRLEIANLHKGPGATMVYVTHDQVEAMTLADRTVALRAGRVEQVGTLLGLYDDPDNLFVAGFIGSPKMNFFPIVALAGNGAGAVVRLPRQDGLEVPLPVAAPVAEGRNLILGLRPERFDPNGPVGFETRVDVIEHLGSAPYAYGDPEADEPLTIELPRNSGVKEGTLLRAGFGPAHAHLFDAGTGLRLR